MEIDNTMNNQNYIRKTKISRFTIATCVFICLHTFSFAQALVVDHDCTDINRVPKYWIEKAKSDCRIAYGYSSHGSQIITGMEILMDKFDLFAFNHDGTDGALSLYKRTPLGDLGNPDRITWAERTRVLLDTPGCDRNIIIWAWCGQAETTEENIDLYLSLMSQLEEDYPDVIFVYMTGHLAGTGEEGILHQRNNQIREYCRTYNKVLYDFADIESYDPDGNYFLDKYADDHCNYDSDGDRTRDANWAVEWCDANSGECPSCEECIHSHCLNCYLKGKAFWWMMARMAGWDGYREQSDFLGTWPGQGVSYRDSDTGDWIELATQADQVTASDLDADGIDDLIGLWTSQGGVWSKFSTTDGWIKLASIANWIAGGDMNGDGHDDFLGTWTGQGVFSRNSANNQWLKMATPAAQITAGDLDDDGTDDLIGNWPDQDGVWVKYSSSGNWAKLSSTSDWVACGDMNGDGWDDLLGVWSGQGVFYKDSATGSWIKMATPATQIAVGDLDADGTEDLVGIWPDQDGVWVKYSSDDTWERLSSPADWIACGKMRGASDSPTEGALKGSIGSIASGPSWVDMHEDLSSTGPESWNFVYEEEADLIPKMQEKLGIRKIPGPGEHGFKYIEQKNLVPGQSLKVKRDRKN